MGNGKRQWYRIRAQADETVADIWIYDIIGESFFEDGVSAKDFLAELQALPASITTLRIHVNSPGGDVFDAVAIHNLMRAQATEKGRTVEVLIEALAASAATIVTSAGDTVKIASNALMMVHNPRAFVMGDANDMLSMAEALESVRDAIIMSYRRHSALSDAEIKALMDATTWMDAEAAVANGFATEIMEPVAVAAYFNPAAITALGEVPEPYRVRLVSLVGQAPPQDLPAPTPEPVQPPIPGGAVAEPMDAQAILRTCKAAGCLDVAEELIAARATPDQVKARIAQVKEVRALCAAAKMPELAESYIRAATPVAEVKAQLTVIAAKRDAAEIDAHLPPDPHASTPRPQIDRKGIYERFNKPLARNGGRP